MLSQSIPKRRKPALTHKRTTPHTRKASTIRRNHSIPPSHVDTLMEGIVSGDRRSLARSITLIESTNTKHMAQADDLLRKILKHRSEHPQTHRDLNDWKGDDEFIKANKIPTFDEVTKQDLAYPKLLHRHRPLPAIFARRQRLRVPLRIGITGVPGTGKSSFIEAFGMHLIEKYNLRIAVLTIDPSSLLTGGSILGDKTRMQRLSFHDNAYIRPSPSKGILGGISAFTADVITLCEYANFDIIFIESVGTGQSETQISQVSDMLINLLNCGAGTHLQGIKKGLMEVSDLVVVTKADGELYNTAERTKADYQTAMQMYHTTSSLYGWFPRVTMSSIKEDSQRYFDNIYANILEYEHCLLQPISQLSPAILHALHLIVDDHGVDAAAGAASLHKHATTTTTTSSSSSSSSSPTTTTTTTTTSPQSISTYGHDRTLLDVKRANQRVQWMWTQISHTMNQQFRDFVAVDKETLPAIKMDLIRDLLTPRIAASQSLEAFIDHRIKHHQQAQHEQEQQHQHHHEQPQHHQQHQQQHGHHQQHQHHEVK